VGAIVDDGVEYLICLVEPFSGPHLDFIKHLQHPSDFANNPSVTSITINYLDLDNHMLLYTRFEHKSRLTLSATGVGEESSPLFFVFVRLVSFKPGPYDHECVRGSMI